MPRIEFLNVEKLMAMHQAIQRDKHDPDDTLQIALTHREVALLVSGVVLVDILMPEFVNWTDDLISKLQEVTGAQDFFTNKTDNDSQEEDP